MGVIVAQTASAYKLEIEKMGTKRHEGIREVCLAVRWQLKCWLRYRAEDHAAVIIAWWVGWLGILKGRWPNEADYKKRFPDFKLGLDGLLKTLDGR